MRFALLLPAALAAGFVSPAAAQEEPLPPRPPRFERDVRIARAPRAFSLLAARPGVGIGVTTTSAASSRDTLGVLVSSVLPGSPAENAGIQEGDRIAAVNGVNLRLAASDIGFDEMSGIMSRRLSRELDKLKPGDELELRIYSNGKQKTLNVKSADTDSLYRTAARRRVEDRPTLGVGIASTGSERDSLGVFVISVENGGPAEKAGIVEGDRIASINGIDLRRESDDDDDMPLTNSRLARLQREVAKLHPGDEATLHVYAGGHYRDVTVKIARAGDLPHHGRFMTVIRGDAPFMALENLRTELPGVRDEVRRAMTEAGAATAHAFGDMHFDFAPGFGRSRVVW